MGQVEINLTHLQPDFYISNAHKWFFTPKSCAFLHAPQYQAHFYPLVVSHGYHYQDTDKLHAMLIDWHTRLFALFMYP